MVLRNLIFPRTVQEIFMNNHNFLIVGHRGLSERHVENSLEGFVSARNSGIDGVELDVQLTRDGKVVVFHDNELVRLCGKKGYVWDHTLNELRRFNLGGRHETIPALSEVLDVLGDFPVFIELKTVDEMGNTVNKGLEEKVIEEISFRDTSQYRFLSFDPRPLKKLKEKKRTLVTGFNVFPGTIEYFGNIDPILLRKYDIDFLQPEYNMFLAGEVNSIVKEGIPVIPWTVNDEKIARLCKDGGATGVITDIPMKLSSKLNLFD